MFPVRTGTEHTKITQENFRFLLVDFVDFVSFVPRSSGRDRQQSFDLQQILTKSSQTEFVSRS